MTMKARKQYPLPDAWSEIFVTKQQMQIDHLIDHLIERNHPRWNKEAA